MFSLPLHRLELELLSKQKEKSRVEECSEVRKETLRGSECLEQDVRDPTQNSSELASTISKENGLQTLESSDISDISEKIGTLQLAEELSDARTEATNDQAVAVGKSSLLHLYYGVSPAEREEKSTNGIICVHG